LSAFNSPKLNFPESHSSWYYSHRSTLNCRVLIGSWPSRLYNALCQEWCVYTYKHISIPRWCETSQSLPLGTQRHHWRPSWASALSQGLGNGSDTICNDPPPMTQYYPLLTLPNQTSQVVTYLGTILVEVRLTTEFW
jgi:hypothetical protein